MLAGPILIGLDLGQLAGGDTGENKARTAYLFQICQMATVKGQNLYVCFDEIVKFSTENITLRFGTSKIADLYLSHIWLEIIIRE